MTDALKWGLLQENHGEVWLTPRPVVDIEPTATAGNVLTGETYDPGQFQLTLALRLCPWCGRDLPRPDEEEFS